jgi:hypothetical protein
MSTRATYRITATHSGGSESQCFYIHYDGYPHGAVVYFEEFLDNLEKIIKDGRYRDGKCIAAFGMLPLSEFIDDHDSRGDAEYRYNIYYNREEEDFYLTAFEHRWAGEGRDIWEEFFKGDLREFINTHKNERK